MTIEEYLTAIKQACSVVKEIRDDKEIALSTRVAAQKADSSLALLQLELIEPLLEWSKKGNKSQKDIVMRYL